VAVADSPLGAEAGPCSAMGKDEEASKAVADGPLGAGVYPCSAMGKNEEVSKGEPTAGNATAEGAADSEVDTDLESQAPDDEPTGSAALRMLCPTRHDLQRFVVPWSGDFTCDSCGQEMPMGDVMWNCRSCGDDLCDSCFCGGVGKAADGEASPSRWCRGSRPVPTPAHHKLLMNWDYYGEASDDELAVSCNFCNYRFDQSPDANLYKAALDNRQLCLFVQALREELLGGAPRKTSRARPAHERTPEAATLRATPDTSCYFRMDQDLALRIVNATTAKVSRLMAKVQDMSADEKKVLIAQATKLETSSEYIAALQYLQRDPPCQILGVDPLGGILCE